MNRIEIFRNWLNTNKVFFELTFTAMSIITLILSIYISSIALDTANKANKIAENQNFIMKEENQPIFTFDNDMETTFNLSNGEEIDIHNVGKPAYDFLIEPYILIGIHDYGFENETKNAFIPILNYYDRYDTTHASIGHMKLMYRSVSYNYTSDILMKIQEDVDNFVNGKPDYFDLSKKQINVDLYTFFRITYIDIYGEKHDEIYYVDAYKKSYKLSEQDKIQFIKEYNKQHTYGKDIVEVKYVPPNEIVNRLSNDSFENFVLPNANSLL